MRRWLPLLLICLPVWSVFAQEDEGFLAGLIEDNLSGVGRQVDIRGFEGALSSRATIDTLTIADDTGIWVTLTDVVLDWNRAALLRGRLEVRELSAARVELPRLPESSDTAPSPEASGFSLPDLPVSVAIERFEIGRILLGAPVLGERIQLTTSASANLAGGSGAVELTAERIDGVRGEFVIAGEFEAGSQQTALQISLDEEADGIAATLAQLPGRPALSAEIAGAGPLNDFTTEISVSSDGEERLSGTVELIAEDGEDGQLPHRSFVADLGGDVTELFAPQYRAFFGEDISLNVTGKRTSEGALDLSQIRLAAEAIRLDGLVRLNEDNWPEFLDITGSLGSPDGAPVVLPLPGDPTQVAEADLAITFDASQSNLWSGDFVLQDLAGPNIALNQFDIKAEGLLNGDTGTIGNLTAVAEIIADGIALEDAALSAAVGDRVTGGLSLSYTEGAPLEFSEIALEGDDYSLEGRANIDALESAFASDFDVQLEATDLTRFAALTGQSLSGSADLNIVGNADIGGAFDLEISGGTTDLALEIEQVDPLLAGRTELDLAATRSETGFELPRLDLTNAELDLKANASIATGQSRAEFDARLQDIARIVDGHSGPVTLRGTASEDAIGWKIDTVATAPYETRATLSAALREDGTDISYDVSLPEVNPLVPQISGPLQLTGTANGTPDNQWQVNARATGPYDGRASFAAQFDDGQSDITYDVSLPEVNAVVPQINGPLSLRGTASGTPDDLWRVDADASGPYDGAATFGATFEDGASEITYDIALPEVRPLVPQISGPLSLVGTASGTAENDWSIDTRASGPYNAKARVAGLATGPEALLRYTLSLPDIGPLAGDIRGPLAATGSVRKAGDDWQIDTNAKGPAGSTAKVAGRVLPDNSLDIDITGAAPLGLSAPFLAPRSLQGLAQFDLALRGAAGLEALSGQITTSGARFAAPNLQLALEDISSRIDIANSRTQLDLTTNPSTGGQIRVSGPVALTGGYQGDLTIALNNLVLTDPALYRTQLGGQITMTGSLQNGAILRGQIDVGRTEITVPSSGLTSLGEIPDITHRAIPRPVQRTRERAGLVAETNSGTSGSTTAYPLDITISAPSQIFVRGRGIDAELGGAVQLSGTTAQTVSSGQFSLIRGRLDILGERFTLDDGQIQLQGSFDPYLRFVATTDTSSGSASVILDGPASEPQVSFEATPSAPEDEVLAQIFFGRDISQISALQALQLANAVATLSGRGGEGLVSKLRGNFGLDDLDVSSDEDGNAEVTAGKYISENVYTDVTVGSDGDSSVSLNLDITPSLTARGQVQTDGNTSLGIFFERDY